MVVEFLQSTDVVSSGRRGRDVQHYVIKFVILATGEFSPVSFETDRHDITIMLLKNPIIN